MPLLRARARPGELEVEFRAQVEAVLAAGLSPTHLDWHALRFGVRAEFPALMARLTLEYGLALRVIGRASIDSLQRQGLPVIDHDFLDSSGLDPRTKPARYAQLLRALPPGLSEWTNHPGLDTDELLARQSVTAVTLCRALPRRWKRMAIQARLASPGH